MDQIKKAVIALDLSTMDDHILQYTNILAQPLRLLRLDLVHVIPDDFIQTGREYGMPEGASLINIVDSQVRSTIQKKVKQYLKDTDLDIQVHVIEGNPYKAILQHINENGIDLLIAGRKEFSEGSGITAKRIARKAKCNFLFVPEVSLSAPKRVMVPIDFSDNSAEALYAALTLKTAFPRMEIITPHIMKMLPADYYYEMDKNKFFVDAHINKNKKAFEYFVKEYELPKDQFTEVLLEDHYNSISRRLMTYLDEEDFDMVIMGAQGHKLMDRIMYGSVTERFVYYCADTPLLVVR